MGKKIDKAARYVSRKVGGGDLTEYLGAAIAKHRAPAGQKRYIRSNATRKQATQSAAKVGLNLATLGSGGAVSRAARAGKPSGLKKAPSSFKMGNKTVRVNRSVPARMTPVKNAPARFRVRYQ